MVLDETSAGLDAETAALVTRSIEALSPGRILLIIAHRLDTVRTVDRVLVIEEGHVVEHGRPDDLMARGSRFADMVGILEGAGF